MNKKIRYEGHGVVYGSLWSGGEGSYPAVRIHGEDLAAMNIKATQDLQSLDSGMGFEHIHCALYRIVAYATIIFEGEEYTNTTLEDEHMLIGEGTDSEITNMFDSIDNYIAYGVL